MRTKEGKSADLNFLSTDAMNYLAGSRRKKKKKKRLTKMFVSRAWMFNVSTSSWYECKRLLQDRWLVGSKFSRRINVNVGLIKPHFVRVISGRASRFCLNCSARVTQMWYNFLNVLGVETKVAARPFTILVKLLSDLILWIMLQVMFAHTRIRCIKSLSWGKVYTPELLKYCSTSRQTMGLLIINQY